MKTLSRFVAKFTSLIVAVLSCFDRVIFKGHLALAAPREIEYFVDCVLKVRRSDFIKTMAPQYSDRLVAHAQGWAQKAGRTYVYRTGQFRKDEWAQGLIGEHRITEGLVGILCTAPWKPAPPSHSCPARIGLSSSADPGNNVSSIITSSIPSSV